MKRLFLCLTLLMLALPAHADFPDRVRSDLPALTISVTEDAFNEAADRPYTLTAHITAEDGSLAQAVTWHSNETPNIERAAALVLLVDHNFDGYHDLQLLTAAGARNVFYAFALWNPQQGRFDEVTTLHGEQLEVCNPILYHDRREILSIVQDGWRYRTETLLWWRDDRTVVERVIAEVYDPGMNDYVGERLTIVDGDQRHILWDQVCEEAWYYGMAEGASDHHGAALGLFTYEGEYPYAIQVTHEDFVYLRSRDDVNSTPLARLPGGTTVYVLLTGIGPDGGWVLVWHDTGNIDEVRGHVGYVWHSFLGPWPMRVANVDWVHIREQPDKQAPSIAQLDRDTLVYPDGEEVDGWTPVTVYYEDGGSFSGYIWHSFLKETEY